MMIERLGPADPLAPLNNSAKNPRVGKTEKSDAINFSSEAQEKGELLRAVEVTRTAPDVRPERVAEIRKKMENPSYINDTVVSAVADRVMDLFGL
jgi:negative regulator of flagellin synthesis FlgM